MVGYGRLPCSNDCSLLDMGDPYQDNEVKVSLVSSRNMINVLIQHKKGNQPDHSQVKKRLGDIQGRVVSQTRCIKNLHLWTRVKLCPSMRASTRHMTMAGTKVLVCQ